MSRRLTKNTCFCRLKQEEETGVGFEVVLLSADFQLSTFCQETSYPSTNPSSS